MIRSLLHGKWDPNTSPVVSSEPPLAELGFDAPPGVRDALSRLGRSEDLRFSPENRTLAIAGFAQHKLLLLTFASTRGAQPAVEFSDFLEIRSPGVGLVHGLDFIDERTLVVANRDGSVAVLRIPDGDFGGREIALEPEVTLRGRHIQNPGSVAVVDGGGGSIGLLVCNNYVHRVTRYDLDRIDFGERGHELVARWGLNVPDGIALSHDSQFMAVSSHKTHDVKVYLNADPAGADRKAVAELCGVRYAHGLRFTPGDGHVLVADAGAPIVRVYELGDGWSGEKAPVRSCVVLDRETFLQGHKNPEEGGPKGLDIDGSGQVVALTCEEKALSLFPLAAFTGE